MMRIGRHFVRRQHKGHVNTPTLDMYFRLPLEDLIDEPGQHGEQRPIQRIGNNCFIANGRGIIIRYADKDELHRLKAAGLRACAYLIDDDLHALEQDDSLPWRYRRRLLRFRRRILPEILDLCDTIIAPNKLILKNYPGKQHYLLHPAPIGICKDFSHFAPGRDIRIVFAGTRSHLRDLAFIAPVIADVCRHHTRVNLTTFLGRHAPPILRALPNATHLPPQPWENYRSMLQSMRFHIALAPLLDTAFNRARSISKLLDHAAFGAAGLHSMGFLSCDFIRNGLDGLCLPNTPQAWRQAIKEQIAGFPSGPGQMAERMASRLMALNQRQQCRNMWLSFLGLA